MASDLTEHASARPIGRYLLFGEIASGGMATVHLGRLNGPAGFAQQGVSTTGTDNKPSVFTALQDKLGLKLESQKAPGEILVIDHAEKPSEN